MRAWLYLPETGDVPRVVVRGDGAHEALGRVDVVHPDNGRGGPGHYGGHISQSGDLLTRGLT